ncbi:MAG TPA: SPASM domain-containing protein [Desulfotignum sp.]|nr:SPASM domain-containing protein [Desulfotignum sp.]
MAKDTAKHPLEVYRFFKNLGIEFIQFSPVVERLPDAVSTQHGLSLAGPAALDAVREQTAVTPWTVDAQDYGNFLIAIYEEWIAHDIGSIFVMNFEWALNAWVGNPSPVCIHARQCGRSLVIEHNGDVYACDHCVYPGYRLGNIITDLLPDMVKKSLNSGFGLTKETALPEYCKECDVLAACQGGCPKHRFAKTCYGEPGLQYLCHGYKEFFLHIRKYLRAMTQLLEHGLPLSLMKDAVKGPLAVKLEKKESERKLECRK